MLEHSPDMMDMLMQSLREDQNVIEIDEDKLVEHVSEHVLKQGLKNSRGIGEAEGHYQVLVMPRRSVKCRFPFISLSDPDQMVGIAKV